MLIAKRDTWVVFFQAGCYFLHKLEYFAEIIQILIGNLSRYFATYFYYISLGGNLIGYILISLTSHTNTV